MHTNNTGSNEFQGKKYMCRSSEQDMATNLSQDNTNDRKDIESSLSS
jgi:hypothetical protein